MTPFPLVLSSPSGGGKTTIAQALLAARDDVGYSVSATTRPPRPGEVDGEHYHFLSVEEFEHRLAADEFVEWAEYSGHRYGTLQSEIDAVLGSGRHCVLDIEIQGARQVRQRYFDAVLVFILPPSAQELMRRLGGPGGTRAQTLERRLRHAVEEIAEALRYDYVVVNADRVEATAEVAAILDAEVRRPRRTPELESQLADLGRDIAALADRVATNQEA